MMMLTELDRIKMKPKKNKNGMGRLRPNLLAFYQFDSGRKGFLAKEDFKVASIGLLGYKPSKIEIDRLFDQNSITSEDGQIMQGLTLDKFTAVMSRKIGSNDEDEEIRQMFLTFDSKCHGFLTIDDIKRTQSIVAPKLPLHSIESAFREIDRDGDGRITYRDFEFMMKYYLDESS